MLAFGAGVGVVFPPFTKVVLEADRALSLLFFCMCIGAGLLVGIANYALFHVVVSRQLGRVVNAMRRINERVGRYGGALCAEEGGCTVELDSHDAIGSIAESFNGMTRTVTERLEYERYTRELVAQLSESADLAKVGRVLLERSGQTVGAEMGLLYVPEQEHWRAVALHGLDMPDAGPPRLPEDSGLLERAFSADAPVLTEPDPELAWIQQQTPWGTVRPTWLLVVPFAFQGTPCGAILLAGTERRPAERAIHPLNAHRELAAAHLNNAVLHHRLSQQAALDELTGLHNRRFGLDELRKSFSNALRQGIPVSVFILDVDHFKRFNDTFGHDAGDRVLQRVARCLGESIREGDVLCRYGGEEFLLAAFGAGARDVAAFGERIRRRVETTAVPWKGRRLSVTVSIGTATWPIVRVSEAEDLITLADEALYHAKRTGRNRVSVHDGEQTRTARHPAPSEE